MRRWILGGLLLALFAAVGALVYQLLDEDDDEKIAGVIEEAATSDDPEICFDLFTQDYLEQTTGLPGEASVSTCEVSINEPATQARSVQVSEIQINGDTATADAIYAGTPFNGSTVTYRLVRAGDEWRLDARLGFARLDRAGLEEGLRESFTAPPVSLSADGAECATQRIVSLSDSGVERVLLSANASEYFRALVGCDRDAYVEGLERDMLEFGDPPSLVSCFRAATDRLTDDELVDLFLDPVAYALISVECDRDAVLASYGRAAAEGGASQDAADCVVSKLDELGDGELARLAVDGSELNRIYPECGIGD